MPRTKQFNEEEILNKAMELFWEKGFHATSIQDLVSHLGINRASLYDTFGGKDELFNKAFAHYRSITGNMLNSIFGDTENVKAGFQKLFDKAIEETLEDDSRKGCFVVNTTTELIPGDKALLNILCENKSNLEALFTRFIQNGIDSGELPKSLDAESTALMLFTIYNGLRVVAKVDPNPIKLKKTVSAALSVLDG
ncbi:TetR/AcrR family transcriptional regulator [Flagellimonas nanhaiensis]|uniref:TetR/AcrR family transcriptional regulator n=1 Tax=Flagellimonas nanhaiensis TaxID=2292706 RepID=A0A371JRH2_9FLAO|nr:TetR/AcrR family transcriptional regulator [Allomuricauda nanhaiensis]RDY60095.1 TetR/AcrR family transcriptional regulator [Allomuricauda nanhaiensis]